MLGRGVRKQGWLQIGLTIAALVGGSARTSPGEEPLPSYQKVSGVEGSLNSIGSDTLNHLMVHWAQAFREFYPSVRFEIDGRGSSTAPPAVGQGLAQLGPISRKMRPDEEDAFERYRGFKPTCLSVALDCVAVYVHKDNPIQELTMAQVDGLFSATHHSGWPDVTRWGELGAAGSWSEVPVQLYGRNLTSGTHAFFKQTVLLNGEYKETVKEQIGSEAVVQSVAHDRAGIGYSSIGYKTADVRALLLARNEDYPYVEATFENALGGTYPLGRTLYIYVAKRPGERLPKLNEEFIKFVLSRDGQQVVVKAGYGALPHDVVTQQLELLK